MASGPRGRKPPSRLSERFMKYLHKAKTSGWQNPLTEVITLPTHPALPYFLIPVYTIRNGHLTRLENDVLAFAAARVRDRLLLGPLQRGGLRLLRLRHMEIDHQRPRKGGEMEALAKTMRVLGLTLAGPHGGKCVQLRQLVQQAMDDNANMGEEGKETLATDEGFENFWQQFDDGIACDCLPGDVPPDGRTPLKPVVPKPDRGPAVQTSMVQDRYTLNWEGEVFYSFIRAFGMEKVEVLVTGTGCEIFSTMRRILSTEQQVGVVKAAIEGEVAER
ncbi:hypothetical protein CSOJ01_16046 [Colletotrichum sojae]|uniref:Uncharacterized protein n=1 Tax=Colletotrichum sojae TaxID=2175907 RepID=A0A8H6ILF5_9PEZI|nr:hypothetical protein CSOJ01_16046 [Colletotrichum sojae]